MSDVRLFVCLYKRSSCPISQQILVLSIPMDLSWLREFQKTVWAWFETKNIFETFFRIGYMFVCPSQMFVCLSHFFYFIPIGYMFVCLSQMFVCLSHMFVCPLHIQTNIILYQGYEGNLVKKQDEQTKIGEVTISAPSPPKGEQWPP